MITEEGTQKQFNSEEESNNEDKVDPPYDDPTIMEEGEQKQFDPEEWDKEE